MYLGLLKQSLTSRSPAHNLWLMDFRCIDKIETQTAAVSHATSNPAYRIDIEVIVHIMIMELKI